MRLKQGKDGNWVTYITKEGAAIALDQKTKQKTATEA